MMYDEMFVIFVGDMCDGMTCVMCECVNAG